MEDFEKFDIVFYMTHEQAGIACYREEYNKISLFEYDGMYVKKIEPDLPNMVCTQVLYYGETLGVKEKMQFLKYGGVGIGVKEFYNEDGTLNHTEDLDKHFPITWAQMEEILKDQDISLLLIYSIFRYYDKEKNTATWSIIIHLPMQKGCLYVFDARTGELLNKQILDISLKM